MKKTKLNCDIVLRDNFISLMSNDKSVLHVGCTDSPYYEEAYKTNRLLHLKLLRCAKNLKGTDISLEGVKFLKSVNSNLDIDISDIMDPDCVGKYFGLYDLVVLSDVLEHLPNPGIALSNIAAIMSADSKLIITVPNSLALKASLRALVGIELVHQDHMCYYSFSTLSKILNTYSLYPENLFSYVGGGSSIFAKALNPIFHLVPWLADGIGIVASKNIISNQPIYSR